MPENKSLATWATQWYEANSIEKISIAKIDAALIAKDPWSKREIRWATPTAGSIDSSRVKSGEQAQFKPFTGQQISAVREIFEYLSLATGLRFTEAKSGLTDINIGFGNLKAGMGGYALLPREGVSSDVRISSAFDAGGSSTTTSQDSQLTAYGYTVLLHEIGHALGLSHPHETGAKKETDTAQSSIMSYNLYYNHNSGSGSDRYGTTYMPTDVIALQQLYGKASTPASETTYEFVSSRNLYQSSKYTNTNAVGIEVEGNTIRLDIKCPSYIFTDTGKVNIDLRRTNESTFVNLSERILGSRLTSASFQEDGRTGLANLTKESVYTNHYDINNPEIGLWKDSFKNDVASCLINPNAKIGTVWGSTNWDLIKGDSSDNTIYAEDGSDTIIRTAGNDFYDGGSAGFGQGDTLVIDDNITNYKIKRESFSPSGSIFSLINKADGSKSRCTNLEIYKFKDSTLDLAGAFDQVTGLNTADAQIFRLYNAAFARIPDSSGLKYWISEYTRGSSSYQNIAQSFLVSNEFKSKYGANNTNEEFAKTLYSNILGRAPDSIGLNYWVSSLNSGRDTRVSALCGFSESIENKNIFSDLTGLSN